MKTLYAILAVAAIAGLVATAVRTVPAIWAEQPLDALVTAFCYALAAGTLAEQLLASRNTGQEP